MATTGASLQPIFERLNETPTYHPLEADMFADWSLEAGDVITVSRDGNNYESPVHTVTHTWKGQPAARVSSGGDERRNAVAKVSRRKYAGGGSGARSGQYYYKAISDAYSGLSSLVVQTESEWSSHLTDFYNGLSGYVEQTASHWESSLSDAYNGLSATVEQTASSWASSLNNAYQGLSATVEQTASSWTSTFNNAYQGLSGFVEQTASRWTSKLDDAYNGLSGYVSQTASSWTSRLNNAYSRLSSFVEQTASNWGATVAGVVGEDGRVTAASIAIAINESGSNASISADRVSVNGTTKLNQVMTVTDNAVGFSEPAIFSDNVNIGNTGTLNVYNVTLQGSDPISFDATTFKDAIAKAEVNTTTNTLTLTTFSGEQIDFRKAVSHNPAATLPVPASAEPPSAQFTMLGTLTPESNDQWYTQTATCETSITQYKLKVHVPLQTKTFTSNGTYIPDSGYLGFGAVIVDTGETPVVTPTLSGSWSGQVLTVSSSPAAASNYIVSFDTTTASGTNKVVLDVTGNGTPSKSNIDGYITVPVKIEQVYSSTSPSVRKTKDISANVTGLLQRKTVTSNDTYTPDSGFIGFSAVEVDVQGTEAYSAGWTAAYGKVSLAKTEDTGNAGITIYTPPSTVDGNAVATSYTMQNVSKNYADLLTSVNGEIRTVARLTHNRYNGGWAAAYADVDIPDSQNLNPDMYLYTPSSTVDGTRVQTHFELTITQNYANLWNRDSSDIVARIPNTYYDNGWLAAADVLSVPTTQDTGVTSRDLITPSKTTVGATDTYVLSLSNASKNYANLRIALNGGSNTVIARLTHNRYNGGWSAAQAQVSLATSSSTSSAGITIKTPSSTVDGNAVSTSYSMVNASKNYADLQTSVGGVITTVARLTHNRYNGGWSAAYSKVALPGSGTGSSMTVKTPPSSVDGTATSTTYTVSADNNYAYIKVGSTVMARATNNAYANGGKSAWIGYVGDSYNDQGRLSPAQRILLYYGGSTNNKIATWYVPEGWFVYKDSPGSSHQGTLTPGKYLNLCYRGGGVATTYTNYTWLVPSSSNPYPSSATLTHKFASYSTSTQPSARGTLYYKYGNSYVSAGDGYWFRCSSNMGVTQDGGTKTIHY